VSLPSRGERTSSSTTRPGRRRCPPGLDSDPVDIQSATPEAGVGQLSSSITKYIPAPARRRKISGMSQDVGMRRRLTLSAEPLSNTAGCARAGHARRLALAAVNGKYVTILSFPGAAPGRDLWAGGGVSGAVPAGVGRKRPLWALALWPFLPFFACPVSQLAAFLKA